MEMLIDTYAKFIEEWGKQSRREPYEKAFIQVHKRNVKSEGLDLYKGDYLEGENAG